jgi:hypothetical protein
VRAADVEVPTGEPHRVLGVFDPHVAENWRILRLASGVASAEPDVFDECARNFMVIRLPLPRRSNITSLVANSRQSLAGNGQHHVRGRLLQFDVSTRRVRRGGAPVVGALRLRLPIGRQQATST